MCSHLAPKELPVSESTIVSVDGLEGNLGNTALVNADLREMQMGKVSKFLFFVLAALDSHYLTIIPIEIINPANIKQNLFLFFKGVKSSFQSFKLSLFLFTCKCC